MLKKFKDLTKKRFWRSPSRAEEEDGRIYGEFADALRDEYPSTAQMLKRCAKKKWDTANRLFAMFRQRFGRPHSADPPRKT